MPAPALHLGAVDAVLPRRAGDADRAVPRVLLSGQPAVNDHRARGPSRAAP